MLCLLEQIFKLAQSFIVHNKQLNTNDRLHAVSRIKPGIEVEKGRPMGPVTSYFTARMSKIMCITV